MSSPPSLFDITIIGAGPIGILMALLLHRRGTHLGSVCRISIVDKAAISVLKEPLRDGRTFALTPQTVALLEEIDLWDSLRPYASPIHHILVTEGISQEGTHYDDRLVGKPFGYIVESARLRRSLINRILTIRDIAFFPSHSLDGIEEELFSNRLLFENGISLESRLVIGADGRHSVVREKFSMVARRISYDQMALVCHFAHQHPHRGWAVESFFPEGPFATLPMLGTSDHPHLSGIVWSDRPEKILTLKDLPEDLFNEALSMKLDSHRFGTSQCVSPRWTYPLTGLVTPQMAGHRVALVGDASHVIHPVAGQGLNLGLKDIDTLSLMVAHALSLGLDPGAWELLTRYQRLRRLDVVGYLGITHGLLECFKGTSSVARSIRHEGLRALDNLDFIKKWIMRRGMGKESDYGLSLERQALKEADA